MAATIYDIAKKCNCSTATVSKVLNGTGNISEAKKKEILDAANELGFVRSQSAVSLAKGNHSSRLIGLYLYIVESKAITHELFSRIMNAFRVHAESKGYDVCFIKNIDDEEPYGYDELIKSRGIDGVFALADNLFSEKFSNLLHSKIPLVSFDIFRCRYMVTSENKEAVADMVDYLVSLGHTRICYVYPNESGVSEDRRDGFLMGLKRNNISFDERMIVYGPYFGEGSAKTATDNALATGFNPTVIMYPDDYTAISAISYLKSIGYEVPNDICITGFDGIEVGSVMCPSLTTIKQNADEIGRQAADLLIARINNEEIEDEIVVVPASVVKGESVKDIR